MSVVAIGTLDALFEHDAVGEGVTLDPVLVGGAVGPEFWCLPSGLRLKAMPVITQLPAWLIAYGPGVFLTIRLPRLMAGETDFN